MASGIPGDSARFELTDGERGHPLWARLKAHLVDRLTAARVHNDTCQPEAQTAELRGEIKALKALIALGDERPIIPTTRTAPY